MSHAYAHRFPFVSPLLGGAPLSRGLARGGSLHRLFDEIFGETLGAALERRQQGPPLDVTQSAAGLLVRMPIPGIAPSDVEVTLESGVLTIRAEHPTDIEDTAEKVAWTERGDSRAALRRTLRLPAGTATGEVTATAHDGLLEVSIGTAPERRPRRIDVSEVQAPS